MKSPPSGIGQIYRKYAEVSTCAASIRYYGHMGRSLVTGIAILLVLAGLMLWYLSANPPTPTGTFPESTLGPTVDEPKTITETGTYHEIQAQYPAATALRRSAGPAADEATVALLKEFATNQIDAFKERSGLQTLTEADIESMDLGGERKLVLAITYKSHLSASTVSYVFILYEDTLGAHPNGYYRTFTFDRATGTALNLDDIFNDDVDFLTVLSAQSRASLRATLGENASPDMLEAGTTPHEDNFQNWYLDTGALVIIFPPYQVGPWAIGTQEVRIPKSTLAEMLKAAYL